MRVVHIITDGTETIRKPYLQCPYCNHNDTDIQGFEVDLLDGEQECEHCEKKYWSQIDYKISSYKLQT